MGKEKLAPPTAITADGAAFRLPPPSYEDIMGVYQTSIKDVSVDTDIPTFAYIDIMPKCINSGNIAGNIAPKFGDFSTLIDASNCFLIDNPYMAIWKCESVTKKLSWDKSGKISYELNTMTRHESTFGLLVFIKGLRLWLTRDPNPRGPPQQIGLKNIVPSKMSMEKPTRRAYYSGGKVTTDGEQNNMANDFNHFEALENLTNTIAYMKETLVNDPIPGTILTIETDRIKAYEHFKSDIDPESTSWSENKSRFRRFTQVIRIFYIKGTPAKEELGYKEFVPEVCDEDDSVKPAKFEPFENVITRLAYWVSANQGIRIVNIQQYDAVVNKLLHDVEVCSDSTDDFISTFNELSFARTLRVFYTKSSAVRALPANFISCRLFLPARTGRKTFECMTQTMDRIDFWLRATGLPVYSVETVELLFNEHKPLGADFEKSDYRVQRFSGKQWITAIRLYFTTPFREPNQAELLPLPEYMTGRSVSKSCNIF